MFFLKLDENHIIFKIEMELQVKLVYGTSKERRLVKLFAKLEGHF